MAAASASSNVRVVVRLRPLIGGESQACVHALPLSNTVELYDPERSRYDAAVHHQFDRVCSESVSQQSLFDEEVLPMLPFVFQGMNVTIFAYGNTGAGKTFTMQGTSENPGIIPRAIEHLLASAASVSGRVQFGLSFMEIYNEKVFDLLDLRPDRDLAVREDRDRAIYVADLSQRELASLEAFHELYRDGCAARRTAATTLNAVSSRSHAIVQLSVTVTRADCVLRSRLCLIDLAGSEDNRRTDNRGARLTESGAINKSLFVLGKVIDAINRKEARIPYRDSKLTRLLQDALGGRAHALMVANIGPDRSFFYESSNTLNFAAKSRTIVNQPTVQQEQQQQAKAAADRRAQLSQWHRDKAAGAPAPNAVAAVPARSPSARLSSGSAASADALVDAIEERILRKLRETPLLSRAVGAVAFGESSALQARLERLEATLKSSGSHAGGAISGGAGGVREMTRAKQLIAQGAAAERAGDKAHALRLYAQAHALLPDDEALRARVERMEAALTGRAKRKASLALADEAPVAKLAKPASAATLTAGRAALRAQLATYRLRSPLEDVGNKPAAGLGKAVRVPFQQQQQQQQKSARVDSAPCSSSSSSSYEPSSSASASTSASDAAQPRRRARKAKQPASAATKVTGTTAEPVHYPVVLFSQRLPGELQAAALQAERELVAVLNTGDAKALMRLVTLGKARCEKLLAYRQARAATADAVAFASLADLQHAGLSVKMVEAFFMRNVAEPLLRAGPPPVATAAPDGAAAAMLMVE